jgi:uncharacterized membrane protein YfcA
MAGLELWQLAYLGLVIGLGSFVRGVTGFGSSMIYVVGLTFVMPAATAVPIILLLELVITIWLLPPVWRSVHWRSLALLLIGCAAALPPGLMLLAHLPRAPMQAVIAMVVLGVCLLMRSGFRLRRQPGAVGTIGVGLISGVLTGATSAGGPPAVLYYFSGPQTVAVARASLIAYLGAADLIGTGMAAAEGLIDGQTLERAALAAVPMLLGSWVGVRAYARLDPPRFRRWVIVTLACLSLVSLLTAMLAMTRAAPERTGGLDGTAVPAMPLVMPAAWSEQGSGIGCWPVPPDFRHHEPV